MTTCNLLILVKIHWLKFLKYLSQEFSGDFLKLVKQKGVSPHEYMNSFETFSEDKWPDRCEFYSCLKDGCINERDCLHTVNVWYEFKVKSLGDYCDLC